MHCGRRFGLAGYHARDWCHNLETEATREHQHAMSCEYFAEVTLAVNGADSGWTKQHTPSESKSSNPPAGQDIVQDLLGLHVRTCDSISWHSLCDHSQANLSLSNVRIPEKHEYWTNCTLVRIVDNSDKLKGLSASRCWDRTAGWYISKLPARSPRICMRKELDASSA